MLQIQVLQIEVLQSQVCICRVKEAHNTPWGLALVHALKTSDAKPLLKASHVHQHAIPALNAAELHPEIAPEDGSLGPRPGVAVQNPITSRVEDCKHVRPVAPVPIVELVRSLLDSGRDKVLLGLEPGVLKVVDCMANLYNTTRSIKKSIQNQYIIQRYNVM